MGDALGRQGIATVSTFFGGDSLFITRLGNEINSGFDLWPAKFLGALFFRVGNLTLSETAIFHRGLWTFGFQTILLSIEKPVNDPSTIFPANNFLLFLHRANNLLLII